MVFLLLGYESGSLSAIDVVLFLDPCLSPSYSIVVFLVLLCNLFVVIDHEDDDLQNNRNLQVDRDRQLSSLAH